MPAATQLISGPAGQLEIQVSTPTATPQALAVICHPHPLHGGSMTNKVVHILDKTLSELGALTVRFNFRGVGQSQGVFDHGHGEVADALAVIDWLQHEYTDLAGMPLWLAGFSFGAYIAYTVCQQRQPQRLILVAPPVDMYRFATQVPLPAQSMLIQGEADEIVSADAVQRWSVTQTTALEYVLLDGASHFFHGQLNRIHQAIVAQWQLWSS